MAYEVVTPAPCADCGRPTKRRHRKTRDPLCIDCAESRMCRAMVEMRDLSGESGDKWRAGMIEAVRRSLPGAGAGKE